MANLETRKCVCGKDFEISKFAPKTTLCPECAIVRLANKRKEKKALSRIIQPAEEMEEHPSVESIEKDEIDTDPFRIIEAYDLFGKEAIYVWLLLHGFKVSKTGVLYKQYGTVYVVAPLCNDVKLIASLLDNSGSDIDIESVDDIEELPPNIVSDLLPVASLVWPKGQGGRK